MSLADRLSAAWRWVLQPLMVIAILVLGFAAATGLAASRVAPPTAEAPAYAPLVRVVRAEVGTSPVRVRGNGAIRARTRIGLVPQVGGRVVAMHPDLRPGGCFAAGAVLLRIEPRDYELAVARAEADVAAARTVLAQEQAQAETAREEWSTVNGPRPIPELVARRPQIAEAEARLAAAEAAAEASRLDLERTTLTLPFAGRVVASAVDVGEVVAPSQSVATVYDTRILEVPVPLEVGDLRWVQLAADAAAAAPAQATVQVDLGGRQLELPARAVRIEGEADPLTRLVRVVLEIDTDSLDAWTRARLLPGLFVDVSIAGGALKDVTVLPRAARRDDGMVWVVDEGRLRFATPELRRVDRGGMVVAGLAPGTAVVVSDLDVVVDGMQVRIAEGAP
ncbi:MAG: efflux RND transporter periplasmic adaptor subunit [Planctomycetota bacterium]